MVKPPFCQAIKNDTLPQHVTHGDLFVHDNVGTGFIKTFHVPVMPAPDSNGDLGPQPPDRGQVRAAALFDESIVFKYFA